MRANTIHPGFILRHEVMQPYDISQNALARAMGVSPRRVNEIVHGKRAITAETAIALEEVFGFPAMFWLRLQAEYLVHLARVRLDAAPPRKRVPMQEVGCCLPSYPRRRVDLSRHDTPLYDPWVPPPRGRTGA